MRKEKSSADPAKVNYKEVLAVYDELDELKEQHPDLVAEMNPRLIKKTWFEHFLDTFQHMQERFHRENMVSKKRYCWLCLLGVFGIHHFYSRYWIKGFCYLAVCWNGVSIGLTLIDWMIAFPKNPDENGMIRI